MIRFTDCGKTALSEPLTPVGGFRNEKVEKKSQFNFSVDAWQQEKVSGYMVVT
jgi:hypothetical protein